MWDCRAASSTSLLTTLSGHFGPDSATALGYGFHSPTDKAGTTYASVRWVGRPGIQPSRADQRVWSNCFADAGASSRLTPELVATCRVRVKLLDLCYAAVPDSENQHGVLIVHLVVPFGVVVVKADRVVLSANDVLHGDG